MNNPEAYTRCNLELRVAEYYANISKPESEWKTFEDLASQCIKFGHLICAAAYDQASDLVNAIDYDYLYRWGYYSLLEELYTQLEGKVTDEIRQADNFNGFGRACYMQGKVQRAFCLHQKALALAQKHADQFRTSRELGRLGGLYLQTRQLSVALEYLMRALDISKAGAYRSLELRQRIRLANIYYHLRDLTSATQEWTIALAIARELKNRQREGVCLASLGSVYRRQGDLETALHFYTTAEPILQEAGDRRAESILCNSFAITYRALGEYAKALEFHKRGLEIAYKIGDCDHQEVHLNGIGKLSYISENLEQAAAHYDEALALFKDGDEGGSSYTFVGLGEVNLSQGNVPEAAVCFTHALALEEPYTHHQALLKLGITSLSTDLSEAQEYFSRVIADCQVPDENPQLYENFYAIALANVGLAVCDPGWTSSSQRNNLLVPAVREYKHALSITRIHGVVRDALRDLELIRVAGIEGLEPVFELLEGALNG